MAFSGWGRKCSLTIQSSQVTDNEVNFPLLVTEDTLPSEIFDADGSYPALNGGGDIRFSSDSDGNTQLACEIESFVTDNDPANGKAAIWVKVPSLSSSSNTTIYIWYNKAGESQPAEGDTYGKHAVWDSNFKMVQHMNQTPTGSAGDIVDSTSNSNDGTTYNMDSADQVAGQIDGSLDFDGGDDYVDCGDINAIDTATQLSCSAFVYHNNILSDDSIVEKGDGFNGFIFFRDDVGYVSGRTNVYKIIIWDSADGDTANIETPSDTTLSGTWTHVSATFLANNANGLRLYVNGVETADSPVSTIGINAINAGNLPSTIGIRSDRSTMPFNGTIDEVRISNVARSAGWIATEYNNQNAPGTFLIEGTPESAITTVAKTITAKTNIKNTLTKIITTKARIQKTVFTNISTKANVSTITTNSAIIQAKARIGLLNETIIIAKARIQTAGITKVIQAKANIVIISIPELVSPEKLSSESSPIYLVWKIPSDAYNRNIHAQVQIDKTDNTFNDLEKNLFSFVYNNFEYWNGSNWVEYPNNGVTNTYYGNQARVLVTLTTGTKYWRVKGCVK